MLVEAPSRLDRLCRMSAPAEPDRARRVALVSTPASIHTVRWANGLAGLGQEVHLVALDPRPADGLSDDVEVHRLSPTTPGTLRGYLGLAPRLRGLLTRLAPDLVNSHFATNYGAAASLACRGLGLPHLLSVWGADVYDFPGRSRLHPAALRLILTGATVIGSTSVCMAHQTRRFTSRPIDITPFGVDTDIFLPSRGPVQAGDPVVIGTVKTMAPKYGIDTLIDAFARLQEISGVPTRLRLVGGGPQLEELRGLAERLQVADLVDFTGPVSYDAVPEALGGLDVFAALSTSESFGVAAVEAGACGLPVLVSDAEGLAEVTEDGRTGIVVPRRDPEAAAQALKTLVEDPGRRATMGAAGRAHVEARYSWRRSLELMVAAQDHAVEAAA